MSSLPATPFTVTFMSIFCGFAKSLLGSTSATSLRVPTLKVFKELTPVAVRTRKSCSPSAAVSEILKVTTA